MTTVYFKDSGGVVRGHEIVHAADIQVAVGKGIFSLTPEGARQVIPLKEPPSELEVEMVEEEKETEEEDPIEMVHVDKLLEAVRYVSGTSNVTREGKPLVEAVEKALGRDITAKERDEAWERLTEDE